MKWIVSRVLEIVSLDKVIDGTKELHQTRITKDNNDSEKIKPVIKAILNPSDYCSIAELEEHFREMGNNNY